MAERAGETATETVPEALVPFATVYHFGIGGKTVSIKREGETWMVERRVGGMNYHYLSADGEWAYKHGTGFRSVASAYEALLRFKALIP